MTIVGIDLGTTNSLVAAMADGEPKIIPNALGLPLTPSVVGLDEGGEILVGQAARERLVSHPGKTAAAFKRVMGTNKALQLGKKSFRPEELSALVLRSLKADAEHALGEPVTEAVISVPAYFSDAQRKATKAAGELAGLKVERLINEPTAAALAYGLHRRDVESKFLVFDLGGGTFDVSVLELFEGIMEVHASAGDNFLGGEDFVDLLVESFLREAKLDKKLLTAQQASRLCEAAEQAKLALTAGHEATIKARAGDKDYAWTLDRDRFEALAAPLIARLRKPLERALRDADLKVADLDALVLVGGATRMPLVRALAAKVFGQFPTAHINPDEVVALGAAVQAGLKARDAALDDVVLTDVCPYTLGTDISVRIGNNDYLHDRFLPIIERNTVVPCSRADTVMPLDDRQRTTHIGVYQGESRIASNNIKLGGFSVDVPVGKDIDRSIEIRYTYDINGILEVEATVAATGKKTAIVIEENPGVLSKEEIAIRLKALEGLKIHPRDTLENRTLLARAERVYEEALGDLRDYVGMQITVFEKSLESQDLKEAEAARTELTAFLDEVEADWGL
jgi:molecular chaperone HscC